jgi:phage tail sheath protein FI
MPIYTAPGVAAGFTTVTRRIEGYYERLPVFIGQCASGPVDRPERVIDWDDYKARYGASMTVAMNRDVHAYFLNTSQAAYIVRSGDNAVGNADPGLESYRSSLQAAAGVEEIGTLLLPGISWTQGAQTVIEAAVTQCERLRKQMIIFDPPPGLKLNTRARVEQLSLPLSSYAVSYYPWLRIKNPDYDSANDPRVNKLLLVSPAAVAAAAWAETDVRRGVWKAPAGVDATLTGIRQVQYAVSADVQSILNPLGINCIRKIRRVGTVIWGARTRATQVDPEWKYISVRRTAQYIETSIERGTRWAVFEPNDQPLWSSLREAVNNFMAGLFRAGALQGMKDSEAWFVRCGLGQTMTQADIDRGRVVMEIGFAPLKPAEFIVLRVVQKTA